MHAFFSPLTEIIKISGITSKKATDDSQCGILNHIVDLWQWKEHSKQCGITNIPILYVRGGFLNPYCKYTMGLSQKKSHCVDTMCRFVEHC